MLENQPVLSNKRNVSCSKIQLEPLMGLTLKTPFLYLCESWLCNVTKISCLCSLYRGVCTQAPCYCIIMEYCPYGQLYEILRDGKELPVSLVLEWSKQIASGMNYLHNHKIIHRDLKSPKWVTFYWCAMLRYAGVSK